MASSIPPELLTLIFKACEEPNALQKCSLICRSWHGAAQALLFSSKTVLLEETVPSLFSFLPSFFRRRRRTPSDLQVFLNHSLSWRLGRLITSLDVRADGDAFVLVSNLLPQLVNLRSFTLFFRKKRMLSPSPFFYDGYMLENLVLQNMVLKGLDKEMRQLKGLKHLTLYNVTFEDWDRPLDGASPTQRPVPPTLTLLHIRTTEVQFHAFLRHMHSHLAGITTLDVACSETSSNYGVLQLIDTNRTTLQSLAIHHLIELPPLTKSSFPSLSSLCLGSTPHIGQFLAQLQRLLPTLSDSGPTRPLTTITLLLADTYLLDDLALHTDTWSALQDLLLASAEEIRIVIERTLDEGLNEVAGIMDPLIVTIADLEVHQAFEKLRASGSLEFAVQVMDVDPE